MIILFNESPNVPNRSIGIYRIATVLRRQGLEVEVIDYLSHWDLDILFKYLDSIENIEWFGFSTKFYQPGFSVQSYLTQRNIEGSGLFTRFSVEGENKLISYIKSRKKKLVLGGPNAELVRHMTSDFDIVCMGYSDVSVIAIHNYLVNNGTLISESYNGMQVVNSDRDYPITDLSDLETNYDYTDFISDNEVFPIEIGRGCIFHCAFCEFAHLGKKLGTYIRDKESIKRDIVDRYTQYGSTRFIFVDDTFNDSIEKMQMIKEIREETNIDFQFWAYCRLDLLASKTEQVDLISEIGWRSMTFGVETFNRDSGKAVGKGADPNKLKSFLLQLRERFPDNKFQINLILGLPHDTEETARDTVQWFIDNPTLTQHVKVGSLGIRNSEGRMFSSKFASNPEKYGYTITNKILYKNLQWKTEHMSNSSASKLASELQTKFNESIKGLYDNKNPITEMREEPVVVIDDEGKVHNNLRYIIKTYIAKKLAHRQI